MICQMALQKKYNMCYSAALIVLFKYLDMFSEYSSFLMCSGSVYIMTGRKSIITMHLKLDIFA